MASESSSSTTTTKKLFHFVSRQQQRSNNCRKVKEDYGDTASTDTASKQPLKK